MNTKLQMKHLINCFEGAKKTNSEYIAVAIKTEGSKGYEFIINPKENFNNKLEYYKTAYNNDLTLKKFNGIRIVGFTYANTFVQIEEDFSFLLYA